MKGVEMIAYLREVRPARAFSMHDGLLNDIGLKIIDSWLEMESDKQKADMRRLKPGESVTLPWSRPRHRAAANAPGGPPAG